MRLKRPLVLQIISTIHHFTTSMHSSLFFSLITIVVIGGARLTSSVIPFNILVRGKLVWHFEFEKLVWTGSRKIPAIIREIICIADLQLKKSASAYHTVNNCKIQLWMHIINGDMVRRVQSQFSCHIIPCNQQTQSVQCDTLETNTVWSTYIGGCRSHGLANVRFNWQQCSSWSLRLSLIRRFLEFFLNQFPSILPSLGRGLYFSVKTL